MGLSRRGHRDPESLAARARELAPCYLNIGIAPGVFTKQFGDRQEIFPDEEIPAPLWQRLAPAPDLGGMAASACSTSAATQGTYRSSARSSASVRARRRNSPGAGVSFIEQAEFSRNALGLEVEFRELLLRARTRRAVRPLALLRRLYHLENWGAKRTRQAERACATADWTHVLEMRSSR